MADKLDNIKNDYQGTFVLPGEQRLEATKTIFDRVQAVEKEIAFGQRPADVGEIRSLRNFVGEVMATLSRLEAGHKRRLETVERKQAERDNQ